MSLITLSVMGFFSCQTFYLRSALGRCSSRKLTVFKNQERQQLLPLNVSTINIMIKIKNVWWYQHNTQVIGIIG